MIYYIALHKWEGKGGKRVRMLTCLMCCRSWGRGKLRTSLYGDFLVIWLLMKSRHDKRGMSESSFDGDGT